MYHVLVIYLIRSSNTIMFVTVSCIFFCKGSSINDVMALRGRVSRSLWRYIIGNCSRNCDSGEEFQKFPVDVIYGRPLSGCGYCSIFLNISVALLQWQGEMFKDKTSAYLSPFIFGTIKWTKILKHVVIKVRFHVFMKETSHKSKWMCY